MILSGLLRALGELATPAWIWVILFWILLLPGSYYIIEILKLSTVYVWLLELALNLIGVCICLTVLCNMMWQRNVSATRQTDLELRSDHLYMPVSREVSNASTTASSTAFNI